MNHVSKIHCAKNICGIYGIKDRKNGFYYIGQSSNVRSRLLDHRSSLRRRKSENPQMQNAFTKHGERYFNFYLILVCSVEHLTLFEQLIIDFYKKNKMSFNWGLCADSPKRGTTLSDKTKKKLSDKARNQVHNILSLEHIEALRQSRLGKPGYWRGKKRPGGTRKGSTWTVEQRQKFMKKINKVDRSKNMLRVWAERKKKK